MRFAYADPPYFGCCRLYQHHHPDGLCWDDLDTHRQAGARRMTPDLAAALGWDQPHEPECRCPRCKAVAATRPSQQSIDKYDQQPPAVVAYAAANGDEAAQAYIDWCIATDHDPADDPAYQQDDATSPSAGSAQSVCHRCGLVLTDGLHRTGHRECTR